MIFLHRDRPGNHESHPSREVLHLSIVCTRITKAYEKVHHMRLSNDLMLDAWTKAETHVLI